MDGTWKIRSLRISRVTSTVPLNHTRISTCSWARGCGLSSRWRKRSPCRSATPPLVVGEFREHQFVTLSLVRLVRPTSVSSIGVPKCVLTLACVFLCLRFAVDRRSRRELDHALRLHANACLPSAQDDRQGGNRRGEVGRGGAEARGRTNRPFGETRRAAQRPDLTRTVSTARESIAAVSDPFATEMDHGGVGESPLALWCCESC
jgi:hypothetical protein